MQVEPLIGEPTRSERVEVFPVSLPFEVFYRDNAETLYRALAVTISDADLAREATDEGLARAFAHWQRVGTLENPAGWAYRVGLNWATSRWRKLRRERPIDVDPLRRHSGRDREVTVTTSESPAPMGTFAVAALRNLPLAQRSVVVCRVLLDYSTKETAEALGIAEGTVKSRLARSLQSLRETLEGTA